MLQFHLSRTLSGDLKKHLSDSLDTDAGAMQWYGHRVTVMKRKCVLMMELRSRYCMLFAGLTKQDFDRFPDLFADRLWREVLSICLLDDEHSSQLASLALLTGEQQRYQLGSNRSIQTHLRQAAEHLHDIANQQMGRLPQSGEEQFGCGVQINETLRKCKGDKDYFVPLDRFRDFWLGMLKFQQTQQAQKKKRVPDNVLPFRRH